MHFVGIKKEKVTENGEVHPCKYAEFHRKYYL